MKLWRGAFFLLRQEILGSGISGSLLMRRKIACAENGKSQILSAALPREPGTGKHFSTIIHSLLTTMWRISVGKPGAAQVSLMDLISSLISTSKTAFRAISFSMVSSEDMMVEWSRPMYLPMAGRDISVRRRIK